MLYTYIYMINMKNNANWWNYYHSLNDLKLTTVISNNIKNIRKFQQLICL